MKRKSFLGLTATILFLALFFTGCPQAVDPDKEVVQKPSTTSQKIEAVKTTGEMGKPETAADGTITLTTTDSTGGKYTFKQMGGGYHQFGQQAPAELGITPIAKTSSSLKGHLTVILQKKVQTT